MRLNVMRDSGWDCSRKRRRGSATLVVLILLVVMEVLIVCNTRVLDSLNVELRLVEQKQQQKFAPAPARKPGQP